MKLKTLLIIKAIVCLCFGIPILLVPDFIYSIFGATLAAGGVFAAREYGASLIGNLMLTWFAPQLVAWHRQPVGKAMFFSLFACWRNRWPFLVLGLALGFLFIGVSWSATLLMNVLELSPTLGSMLLAPIALVLTAVAYSTQYPIYRTVIETQLAAAPET